MIWVRVVEAWALAAGLQLGLWIVQQRTKNAGIVDVGWALSFALVVALFIPPRRDAHERHPSLPE